MRTAADNLYLYDPQFQAGANQFVGEMGGSTATFPIRSSRDITQCISSFTNVKFLVFDTHGMPGKISLADGSHYEGLDFLTAGRNPQFLQKDARILFYGCNIGEGKEGDLFMKEVGYYLLRGRGGTVGTTTVPNITFAIGPFSSEVYMQPLSFGRLKVKRYGMAGTETGSQTVDRHGFSR